MKRWVVSSICFALTLSGAFHTNAADESSVDKAREALTKQDEDADSAKQLEEVFQAAEKNYSLLKRGKMSLTYGFDYSYFGDQRLDIDVVEGRFRNFDITPSAQHTFTNSFSFDYGLLDNLTLSTRVPLVAKYDTQSELNATEFGDISLTTRWQPFAYVPGKPSYTVFGTFKSKTGVSPYEIDVNRQLSTGSGYYSFSVGGSFSKVLDPVIIFSSVSLSYPLKEEELNQVRGGTVLTEVEPANSLSLSAGFSYALSYDVSLSVSSQFSYSDETILRFRGGIESVVQDQVSSLMSFALGIRVSDTKIINTSVGFGLTEDSPDVTMGVSIPINIAGLKEE
ncbi:flagellar protein FilC [Hahella sp. CCB-MM4]|uniref:flagellar protein FilC n=1 Tax=Hahella sp. (strain CCB-MM4) TaxID=1926491 RepID=UPI000B9ACFB8|nr:flagellar protein FilC [Hahella sp. CCB-MM4]OZG71282.1 flagellar protein FilC [Hahella sp. CCB-MM4]